MGLRCCKCGQQSSSSSSRSSASSVSSQSASGGSGSSASASASSDSTDINTIDCFWCKDNIAPFEFQMEWTLENNCPVSPGFPSVGCYDQAVGPHYGIISSDPWEILGYGCVFPMNLACFWDNGLTGEVEVTQFGTCGECSNGPNIKIAVGQDSVGNYFMVCYVIFYYQCSGGGFPPPPLSEGHCVLRYTKVSTLPINCMGTNELELDCFNGWDNFIDGDEGSTFDVGVGPGCNTIVHPDNGDPPTTTFPATITIKPSTGGGTFP